MTFTQRLWLPFTTLTLGCFIGFWLGKHSVSSDAHPAKNSTPPQNATAQKSISKHDLALPRAKPLEINNQAVEDSRGFVARLELNSAEEIEQALKRAEALYQALIESKSRSDVDPLAIVVHGPEVEVFFGRNYARYKSIVDLAARLSAFNIVDVKVCETQIDHITQKKPILPPFVEEVPFGPDEVERLLKNEAYVYF